ncbi:MAG: type VI secretion system Vgr family protein [Polyangiaceae bacterium]
MQDNGPITIDSPEPLDDGALFFREMGGSEQLSTCFTYKVLVSSSLELSAADLLGAPIGIHLDTTDGGTRHFHGVIASLQYVGVDESVNYRLVLRPWFWLLTQSANCRIFQNRSVVDIVKSVFDDLGFADYDDTTLTGEYPPKDYVVQYRETDFAFVSRLLERAGIYYFFRHEESKHTLVLADSTTNHDFPPDAAGNGELSVPVRAPDDARAALAEHVDEWVTTTSVDTGVYSHADFDFTNSRAALRSTQSSPAGNAHDQLEVYDYPGGFLAQEAGDAAALVRLQERQVARMTSEARSNARRLTVGRLFSLTDCPRADQNRDYLVTSMIYEMHGHEAETRADDEEPTFRCEFEAIPSDTQFRAPWATDRPIVRGPQTAVVVGPDGDEIWTDAYGRIKVQFHWDRDGQNDENSSCWVRVSQAWAGSSFGAIHLPRIGQEVIVDFLEGDPDRPLVTGRVYNDANMPPYDLPDNQTQSGIKSRSTPGGGFGAGNEIRFEDATGREDLYLHAQNTQTTVVEGDQSIDVRANRSLSVGGSETVTVTGGRSTTVTLADTLAVIGAASTTVGGDQSLTVTGSSELSVTGSYSVSVQGSSDESVEGDFTRTVTGSVDLSLEGVQTETFGDDHTERHTGHRVIVVGGASAKRSSTLHVEGSASIYAATTLDLVAQKGITITCGKSQIVLKPSAVTITSPTIVLTAGDIEMTGKKIAAGASDELDLSTKAFSVNATDTIDLESKTVTMASGGGSVTLDDSAATVQGTKVQLQGGSGGSVQSSQTNAISEKVTTIKLTDQDGKPLANQSVTLRFGGEGGEERVVVLDDTGSVQIPGGDSFEVVFPDYPGAKKG